MNPLLLFGINLGVSLGEAFIKSPQTQKLVGDAVAGAEALILQLTGKHSGSVGATLFVTALQLQIQVLIDAGKLDASTARSLQDAIRATWAADQAAQQVVDAGTLKPVAPLP